MGQKFYIQKKISFENKDKRTFSGKMKLRDFVGRDLYYKNAKGSSLAKGKYVVETQILGTKRKTWKKVNIWIGLRNYFCFFNLNFFTNHIKI